MSEPSDITSLLQGICDGRSNAADQLLELVYHELRNLAASKMRQQSPDHTLQPTALVNEAYLRLNPQGHTWENRAHFFGAASEAMRRVLIDHARKKLALKRGGDRGRITMHEVAVDSPDPDLDLLALDGALSALQRTDARLGEIVRLRYFAGLSIQQSAEVLSISPSTVKRDWNYARAWIIAHIHSQVSEE